LKTVVEEWNLENDPKEKFYMIHQSKEKMNNCISKKTPKP